MGQPYSLAIDIPVSNFLAAFPLCELICTATDHPAITEVWVDVYANASATAIAVGLGRPAAAGTTPVGATYIAADGGNNTATSWVSVATQWTKPPTAPTVFMRRSTLTSPATGGGIARWLFPEGLIVMPGQTLVVWCIGVGTVIGNIRGDVSLVIDG